MDVERGEKNLQAFLDSDLPKKRKSHEPYVLFPVCFLVCNNLITTATGKSIISDQKTMSNTKGSKTKEYCVGLLG
jgi:hypothetical protein